MANIKSQIKRNKTNEKARERNKAVKRDADRFDFAAGEFTAARKRIAPQALRTLVSAFADDLTELAAACQQLISDVDGDITEPVVERY